MIRFRFSQVLKQTMLYGLLYGLVPMATIAAVVVVYHLPNNASRIGLESEAVVMSERLLGYLAVPSLLLVPVYLRYGILRISQKLTGQAKLRRWAAKQLLCRLFPSLFTTVIATALVGLGFVAAVVPGLVALAALCIATPICLNESRPFHTCLYRSMELTSGYRIKILLIYIIFLIVTALLFTAESIFYEQMMVAYGQLSIAEPILQIILFPPILALPFSLWAASCAVIYSHLLEIKEGGQQEKIAAVFD